MLSPEQMRERVKSVVIVLVTPFNRDGSLDVAGLRANTEYLVERCRGKRFVLVPAGSTGEFYALDWPEFQHMVDLFFEVVGPTDLPTSRPWFCHGYSSS